MTQSCTSERGDAALSEIEANEKLREAKYFLEKMRQIDSAGLETGMFRDKEFGYNLDGFLVAWLSVLDVLRYDFAEEFSLITRQDKMPDREYITHLAEALAGKNPKDFSDAAAFYEWMNRQEDGLLKRHAPLRKKRHIVVHRGTVKTGVKEQEWPVNVSSSSSASYLSDFLDSSVGKRSPSEIQAGSIPSPLGEAGAEYLVKEGYTYFKDDPEKHSVVSICESAYEDMTQLVAKAEKGSWRTDR